MIYVALEDKSEIAVLIPGRSKSSGGCAGRSDAPTGLAIDAKTNRLFVGGHNKTMLVMDADTGKKIASFPTGSGTDAAGFTKRPSASSSPMARVILR